MTNEDRQLRGMSDKDLQDESTWDFQNVEEQLPTPERKARAVVSVAFPAEDIGIVSAAARNADMKLSAFIRDAAVERANALTPTTHFEAKPTETQGSATMFSAKESVPTSI